MAKSNPTDFLLNTDYEMDKVILVKTGSFTKTVDIPHNMSFMPLPFGLWSTDSDFKSINTIGPTDINHVPVEEDRLLGVWAESFSDKITLTAVGKDSATAKIYYRLYAFEPSDSVESAPYTSKNANQFILNTDYNYSKILKSGYFTQDNQKYMHNLGYIPQVMGWFRFVGFGDPEIIIGDGVSFGVSTEGLKLIVTDSYIQVKGMNLVNVDRYYWRIYYDEA